MAEIPVTNESRAVLMEWLRDSDDPDTRGLRAGLLAYVEWLEAERDLFRGCCTRAFDKWCELHPDAEKRPDGAAQIVEIMQKAEAQIEMLEEFAWDALCQGAFIEGDKLDNMCMSTWEELSQHFAERGWLTGDNGRIYKIVPNEERPK